jgi:ABC-2 type transporter.
MLAVYKRELKIYFYSPIAYVIIGLFIFLSSLFFNNLFYEGTTDYNSVMSSMGTIFVFLAPMLSMRIISEDRRNGIEVLLLTSPQTITNIVFGKFLALLTVFGVIMLVSLVYPVILLIFGKPFITQIIGGYIGFILLGITFLSIGLFASSLTENQIIAAAISFVILLSMWITDTVSAYAGGTMKEAMNWFSLISRYLDFQMGILNLSNILYYLSFTGLFIFFTMQVIEKKRWSQG